MCRPQREGERSAEFVGVSLSASDGLSLIWQRGVCFRRSDRSRVDFSSGTSGTCHAGRTRTDRSAASSSSPRQRMSRARATLDTIAVHPNPPPTARQQHVGGAQRTSSCRAAGDGASTTPPFACHISSRHESPSSLRETTSCETTWTANSLCTDDCISQ